MGTGLCPLMCCRPKTTCKMPKQKERERERERERGEERNQSAYQNQMGGFTPSNRIKAEKLVGLKGSNKVEDRKKPLVKTDDQKMETSQVRKLNRLTDQGFKGRRKS